MCRGTRSRARCCGTARACCRFIGIARRKPTRVTSRVVTVAAVVGFGEGVVGECDIGALLEYQHDSVVTAMNSCGLPGKDHHRDPRWSRPG
jgi:hypothetical protein